MDVENVADLDSTENIQVDMTESEESQSIARETGQTANEPSPSVNETDEISKELLAIVCKKGGIIDVKDAFGSLSQAGIEFVNERGFYPLLQSSLSGVLTLEIEQPGNQATLRVKVDVELCKDYANTECFLEDECPRLHVCPQFVKGNCVSQENENCNLNHNFSNEHEQEVLRKFKLDTLHEGSILPLLRNIILGVSEGVLNSVEVCSHYNSVPGCPTGVSCSKLHLCTAFSKGECGNRAADCTKSHDVLAEKSRLAKSFKILEQQVIASRIINFRNLLSLARKAAVTRAGPPTIDEICSFHLKGNCHYGRLCKRYWNNLAYLWQITVTFEDESEKWINFPALYNQLIEWDYCDVNKDTSLKINFGGGQEALLHICFDEMVAKTQTGDHSVNIRRISTASWVKASPGDSFGTRWTWYWKNDQDQWVPYDGAGRPSSSTAQNYSCSNESLEEHYLSDAESFTLSLNGQTYNIDLKNFQQVNTATAKSRKIRRRPTKFIGTSDISTVLQLRQRECQTPPSASHQMPPSPLPAVSNVILPQGWTAMSPGQDVVMVTLQPGSAQYNRAQTEFKKTLSGRTIRKIERVQNIDLWESYSRKLSKLSRKLGRPVEVRELFHGTDWNAIKAICQQGFDWRLNGAHGTACGKGSYFAVAASTSDGFSSTSPTTGHKMMFLNKVIVGLYVVGNSSTVRPPAINPNKPYELYHSCVNNQANPSMFVVFENDQAYPEFLISYS